MARSVRVTQRETDWGASSSCIVSFPPPAAIARYGSNPGWAGISTSEFIPQFGMRLDKGLRWGEVGGWFEGPKTRFVFHFHFQKFEKLFWLKQSQNPPQPSPRL